MPNKCYFLRTPFRTVPSVIAHSDFSCKQILPSPEPVGDEGADCMSAGQTRQQDRTMVYSECKVYTKNPHRREAMVPECPHSSLPHLPRRNPWLTMKYFAIFSGKQMQCRSQLELIWDLYLFSSSDGWLKGMLFALEPTGFPGEKHAKGGTSQVWKA